jgi:hypothetical protein
VVSVNCPSPFMEPKAEPASLLSFLSARLRAPLSASWQWGTLEYAKTSGGVAPVGLMRFRSASHGLIENRVHEDAVWRIER